jgi:hypothetical protein
MDFSSTYAELTDDELLQIASDRASLTDEAVTALDAEMRRRKLSHGDIDRHERLVKRAEQLETERRVRKLIGTRGNRPRWFLLGPVFGTLLVIALVTSMYQRIPQRYHFSPDWEQAAEIVLFSSAFILVAGTSWWRKVAFWVSLAVSSAIHAVLVHYWFVHAGNPGNRGRRADEPWAILLGLVLFLVVYGCGFLLRQTGARKT